MWNWLKTLRWPKSRQKGFTYRIPQHGDVVYYWQIQARDDFDFKQRQRLEKRIELLEQRIQSLESQNDDIAKELELSLGLNCHRKGK